LYLESRSDTVSDRLRSYAARFQNACSSQVLGGEARSAVRAQSMRRSSCLYRTPLAT
jgi:hypothetical protein